jgi:hypothetical protein
LFFPFDGMARKGCSLATVARELNRRVREPAADPTASLPRRWWAWTRASNSIRDLERGQSAGAGHHRRRLGSGTHRFDATGAGPQSRQSALFEPRHVYCGSRQQLLLCSDGIWENPAFSAGGDAGAAVAALMAATEPGQRIDALFRAALDAGQSDDLSAVLVTAKTMPGRASMPPPPRSQSVGARLSLQFGPEALRRTDAVASVLDMAGSLGLVDAFPALPTILPELFSNALDYGVLGLDGRSKFLGADEYQAFYAERQRRLDVLTEGFVMIEIEPDYLGDSRVLRLNVADSGMGFDWQALDAAATGPSGAERSLQRVRGMVANLSFNSQGSEVIVLIPAREDDGAPS